MDERKYLFFRNILLLFNKTAKVSIIISCFNAAIMDAQERINLTAGVGLPELISTGIRFPMKENQRQLGLYIGFGGSEAKAMTVDILSHFGGFSDQSERKPWYWRGGLTVYHSSEDIEERTDWDMVFNMRLGREINLSGRLGINLDGGIIISPFAGMLYDEYHVIPGLGLGLFFRIK